MHIAIKNKRVEIYRQFGDSSAINDFHQTIGSSLDRLPQQNTFEAHINELEKKPGLARSDFPKEHWEYYFTKIFPTSLRIFHAMAKYQISDGSINANINPPVA